MDGDSSLEAINGVPYAKDASHFLMSEYCSEPIPDLRVAYADNHACLVLKEDSPPLNEPVDLVSSTVQRGQYRRRDAGGHGYEALGFSSKILTEVLVSDMYLHEETFRELEPRVTLTNVPLDTVGPDAPYGKLDLTVEEEFIGADEIGTAGVEGVPQYSKIRDDCFARLGWNPERFCLHRIRWSYPIQSIIITRWYPLHTEDTDPV